MIAVCVHAKSLQSCLTVTLWTVACQAPLSMRFSRQEYWNGCQALLQGVFLTQGLTPRLLCLPHNTKVNCQITGEKNKRGREEKRPTKANPKQLTKCNISIITLNVLNAPAKRHRLDKWYKNKTHRNLTGGPVVKIPCFQSKECLFDS